MFKQFKYAIFIPALVLLGLVVTKSFQAPFTHDEAFSFEVYSSKSIPEILAFKEEVSANNHLFNTLFMKGIYAMGLSHPGFLRMLSWASFGLFVWSLYQLFKTKEKYLIGFLFLIPCCSPYLLDFFSMARGYAFSFSLLAMTCYLYLKHEVGSKQQIWAVQFATLALLANFNLVYFWFSLLSLHLLQNIRKPNHWQIYNLLKTYLFPLLSLVYLGHVFIQLSSAKQLYFGGNTGFIENVLNDQLWCLIYDQNYSLNPYFLRLWTWMVPGMVVFALVLFGFKQLRNNTHYKIWTTLLYFLVCSCVLVYLNHVLTGSLYPIKRTGLFLTIVFMMTVAYFLLFIYTIIPLKPVYLTFSIGFVGLLYFHTINATQPKRFREIPYDCHTDEILATLATYSKSNEVLDFSANWQFSPSFNFYQETQGLNWLPKLERSPIDTNAQFLLLFEEDFAVLDTQNMQTLLSYPEEEIALIQQFR